MASDVTILISEADLAGNKGAVAMASCLIEVLKRRFPTARFVLTTRFYDAAQEENIGKAHGVHELIDVSKEQVERSLCRVFLWWFLRRFGVDLRFLLSTKLIQGYMKADVVLSLSGISFIEDYGLTSVYHSSKWLELPLCLGKPIVKYSQTIGPLRKGYNRRYAKLLLDCVDILMARGEITEYNLKDIRVDNNIYTCPDIALILPPSYDEHIAEIFTSYRGQAKTIVGVSPNVVCERLASESNVREDSYVTELAAMLDGLTENNDYLFALIPHTHSFRSRRRDDSDLCQDILSKMEHRGSVQILDTKYKTPSELKAIIGLCDLFIGSRFHALVAAISMGVPSIAIGWHPKYEELMTWVDCQEYVCDCRLMDAGYLLSLFEHLERDRSQIAQRLNDIVPVLQDLAYESGDLICDYICRCVMPGKSAVLV